MACNNTWNIHPCYSIPQPYTSRPDLNHSSYISPQHYKRGEVKTVEPAKCVTYFFDKKEDQDFEESYKRKEWAIERSDPAERLSIHHVYNIDGYIKLLLPYLIYQPYMAVLLPYQSVMMRNSDAMHATVYAYTTNIQN